MTRIGRIYTDLFHAANATKQRRRELMIHVIFLFATLNFSIPLSLLRFVSLCILKIRVNPSNPCNPCAKKIKIFVSLVKIPATKSSRAN
jgi:hypothetical protein